MIGADAAACVVLMRDAFGRLKSCVVLLLFLKNTNYVQVMVMLLDM